MKSKSDVFLTTNGAPMTSKPMTPKQYGVGARFTLAVYDADYVQIILGALAEADSSGLSVETGDISTYVTGSEQRVLEYLRDVLAGAAKSGVHLSASILLSRGCPGELQCELPPGVAAMGADPVELRPVGTRARAHWSLYPLLDPAESQGATPVSDHMAPIYEAIEKSKHTGVYSGSDPFATRLDGDLAAVLETIANAWIGVGATVQHVVTHATLSINSPSVIAD